MNPDTQNKVTTITVNNKDVEIKGPKVTGLEIKQAAIDQGVDIQLDFVLSQKKKNGETVIIGDTDIVTINKNSCFRGIADDDDS